MMRVTVLIYCKLKVQLNKICIYAIRLSQNKTIRNVLTEN